MQERPIDKVTKVKVAQQHAEGCGIGEAEGMRDTSALKYFKLADSCITKTAKIET